MPEGEWLDGSSVSLLHLCPKRYYYRHELDLVPKYEGLQSYANAAQYGTALHAALASLYAGEGMVLDTCPCESTCEFCNGNRIPRLVARFLINYPIDPEQVGKYRNPRTRANGIEILKRYVQKYMVQGREDFIVVGSELSFELPFVDADGLVVFTYVGRVDLLTSRDGKLKPIDHKSYSSNDKDRDSAWRLSHQMTGYMRSTHKFTGLPCLEAEMNMIPVKVNWDDSDFHRLTTNRSPEDFEEWEKEVWNAYYLRQMYRQQNFWPKHSPFSCTAYHKLCEYFTLCCSDGNQEMHDNIIENNFEAQPWHPFHGME